MDKTKDETEDMGCKGHVLRRHFLSPFQDPRAALRFGLGYIIAPFWGFGENPGAPGLNIFEVGDRMCKRPPGGAPEVSGHAGAKYGRGMHGIPYRVCPAEGNR